MSRSAAFRKLLTSPGMQIAMGAYDALSAIVVERAGFPAIWASGLCISASAGLRDCSEASVTQVLGVLECMADATSVPILVDGDSGYGNFNNVRQLTRKLERFGLAAVCLEDTLFPRKNSFAVGSHDLASEGDFCGKIRAAKDTQSDPDFSVIARTETLVGGRTIEESLDRCFAYIEAGADAILVHSIKPTAEQVLAFCAQWKNHSPVVIVPTSYYSTPIPHFEAAGVSLLIWANQTLRASIAAIERICREVRKTSTVAHAEPSLTTLSQLFTLLDYDELHRAETLYNASEATNGSVFTIPSLRNVK